MFAVVTGVQTCALPISSVIRAKTKGIQVIATCVSSSSYPAATLACTATNPAPFIDGDCNLLNDPLQTVITINGGDVVNRGIELEATIAPTHRLIFSGNATFLDSKTKKQTIPDVLSAFFPVGDIPLLFTPKTSYSGNVSYRSDEHTSELQSLMRISYAVSFLQKTR